MTDVDWSQFEPVADNDTSADTQSQFASLASAFPDARISSLTRSAEHNADVGGMPTSQHIPRGDNAFGTAMDVVVPKDQRADFKAHAADLGLQAIDEGTHIHLQLPRSSRNVNWGQFQPVDDTSSNGVDWSQFQPAADFSNVKGGANPSEFADVQSGSASAPSFANVESQSPNPYKQFTDMAGNIFDHIPTQEGLMEAATNLESQGYAIPAGGIARLGVDVADKLIPEALRPIPLPTSDEAQQAVTQALTYQPESESGKAATAAVSYPFEKLAEGGQYLGDKTLEATGSPALAAGVYTATQLVPFAVAHKIGEGILAAPDAIHAAAEARINAADAGKPVWDGTKDALDAIQATVESKNKPPVEPTSTPPPEAATAPPEAPLNEYEQAAHNAWTGFTPATDEDVAAHEAGKPLEAPTERPTVGEQATPATTGETAPRASGAATEPSRGTEAHPLFDDIVPSKREPLDIAASAKEEPIAAGSASGAKIALKDDPTVKRDDLGFYYRDGSLVGMPKETTRPRTMEEMQPQLATPQETARQQSFHDAINTKLDNAQKSWEFLAKGDGDIGVLARKILSDGKDRSDVGVKAISPEDLTHSTNGYEQLIGQNWREGSGAPLGLFTRTGPEGPQVYIRGAGFKGDGLNRTTLAHELVHSELLGKIAELKKLHDSIGGGSTDHLHPETGKALDAYRELDRTREALANNPDFVEKKGTPMFYKHAVSNVDELTSVAMTDPGFRRYLKDTKLGAVTAWSKVKEAWSNMLGLGRMGRNVIDHISDQVDKLLKYNPEAAAKKPVNELGWETAEPRASAGERVSKAEIDRQAEAARENGASPDAVAKRVRDLYAEHGHEDTVGISNAKVAEERRLKGQDELEVEMSRAFGPDIAKNASEKVKADPSYGQSLAQSIISKPNRPTSNFEQAVLLTERTRLNNEVHDTHAAIDTAMKSGDRGAEMVNRAKLEDLRQSSDRVDKATRLSGTSAGRALQFRQMQMKSDYTLAAVEQKARVAAGDRGVPEAAATKIKDLTSRIAELDKKLAAKESETIAARRKPIARGDKVKLDNHFQTLVDKLKSIRQADHMVC